MKNELLINSLEVIRKSISENRIFDAGCFIGSLINTLEIAEDKYNDEDNEDEDEDDDEEDKPPYDYFYQMEKKINRELREMLVSRNETIDKLSNHLKLLIKRDHIFTLDETIDLLVSLHLGERESLFGSRGKI
jgi:hypothetical protein